MSLEPKKVRTLALLNKLQPYQLRQLLYCYNVKGFNTESTKIQLIDLVFYHLNDEQTEYEALAKLLRDAGIYSEG